MDALTIGLIVGGFLLLIFIIWFFSTWNRLVRLEENANKSWADIDVLLKQRYDMIPNLVNIVKGYAEHEREIFEQFAQARQTAQVLSHKVTSRALEPLKAFFQACFHASTWLQNSTLTSRPTLRL